MKICRKCYNKGIHIVPCREGQIDKNQAQYGFCKPEVVEEKVTWKRLSDDKSLATPITEDGIEMFEMFSP